MLRSVLGAIEMPQKRFPKAAGLCFMNIELSFDIHKVGVYTPSRGSKGTKFPRKICKNDGTCGASTFANLATVSGTKMCQKPTNF